MTCRSVLSARKRAFVAAITAGLNQTEAAESIGVTPRTGRRYMADPMVRAALSEAMDATFGEISVHMAAGTNDALTVIREVMLSKSISPSVRIRAAQIWLEHCQRFRELNDLANRVAELERKLSDGGEA